MAKLKMLKMPKKPKAGASIRTMESWLAKVEATKKANKDRHAVNVHAEKLQQKISGIGSDYVTATPNRFRAVHFSTKKKKATKKAVSGTKRKKAAPKRRKR